ncbi:PKD domain-containing protein [Methanoregula sp.]|uniref:PKD domain-containing protein n=1 Tax=Methanoregula sp. TaxID=2052170 RepID=UPI003C73C088
MPGNPSQIFINRTVPGDGYSLTPSEPLINHMNPSISGNWVAWYQSNATTGNSDDIYMNDTGTHQTIPVALDRDGVDLTSIAFSPSQSLYRIVWDEQDANGYNVYLYTGGPSQACPVAGFTNDFTGETAPVTVHFTDTSTQSASNPVTHWFWDFGDGSNSTQQNPGHTYTANGQYDVSLTVSNPSCRNATTIINSVVAGSPMAGFTASPTSGVVPATISFTDTSFGNPTQWNWSWGDGTWTNGTILQNPTIQSPAHGYTNPGSYTVSLTASNAYGSNTATKTGYITARAGANVFANTTIPGITIQDYGGRQHLVFNYATLTDWTFNPNSSVLDFTPPADRGFHNISVYTTDPGGFLIFPGNFTITGTIGSVDLQTQDIIPTGFPVSTGGPSSSINYSIVLPSYPENGVLNTQVWEGATASDAANFNYVATGSHFAVTNGTAYTMKIIKTNFPAGGTAQLFMSLNASLVASKPLGRNEVFVERIDDSGQYGQVLGTRFLYHNSPENLDYFEADSPLGLSTFGLSFLEGAGNPLQLITLSVISHISSASSVNTGGGYSAQSYSPGPATGAETGGTASNAPPENGQGLQAPPVDPGKTGKIYANTYGVITQPTILKSTDNLATVTIGNGVVAKDKNSNPLSSVTLAAIPSENIPGSSPGTTYLVNGLAYEVTPDGATFSPAISLSFTIPEAQWGKEYSVKNYDRATGTWQDIPSKFDPSTGTLTAEVTHLCCFAVFASALAVTTHETVPVQPQGTVTLNAPPEAPPPTTAISIFTDLMVWVAERLLKNSYLLVGIVALVCGAYVFMRWKFP